VTVAQALIAFTPAAALLTLTPGLDTAMILRTSTVEGRRSGALAVAGILCGCMAWGAAVALGLGVLITASAAAFTVLKWAGAAYLFWLGLNLILRPRARMDLQVPAAPPGANWWLRGFLTNVLNPKVGVFYVSFLPQFVPVGVAPGPFILLLAAIHVGLGMVWCGALVMATAPLGCWLNRGGVVRWLDRVTGGVFVAFGLRLALERR
jgi:threonine/homoserine/homoserine lactone efflux protein